MVSMLKFIIPSSLWVPAEVAGIDYVAAGCLLRRAGVEDTSPGLPWIDRCYILIDLGSLPSLFY